MTGPYKLPLRVVDDPDLPSGTWEVRDGFGSVLHRMHACGRWCHPGLHMDVWLPVVRLRHGAAGSPPVSVLEYMPHGVGQAMRMLAHFRALDSDED